MSELDYARECDDGINPDEEKDDQFTLTREEVQALVEWLQHEFINSELETVHNVIRRMQSFLKETS